MKEFEREIWISSLIFLIYGFMLLLPNSFFNQASILAITSGLFSNLIGFVTMKTLGIPLHHSMVGLVFLGVSALPLVMEEAYESIQAIFALSAAIYGVSAFIQVILDPVPLSLMHVLSMGVQVLAFGLIATLIKEKVLKSEAYGVEYDLGVYSASFVLVFTGLGSLAYFSSVFQAGVNPSQYYILFSMIYSALAIYGAYELLKQTSRGFWLGMVGLTVVFLVSLLQFGSRIGGIIAVGLQLVIWNRKASFGDISQPVDEIRSRVDF